MLSFRYADVGRRSFKGVALGISGERTLATELARKAEQQTQLGPRLPELRLGHSLETVADFVLW